MMSEVHQLHRRAGDDETVEGAAADLAKGFVEGQHVGLGGVLGHMTPGGDQLQFDLQGGVAKDPGQLGLRVHLGGHQVQQEDLEGADVLGDGPGLRHDEDVLPPQDPGGGQLVGDFDGHITSPAPGPGRCRRSGPACAPGRSSSVPGPRGCRRRQAARRSSAGGWSWRG